MEREKIVLKKFSLFYLKRQDILISFLFSVAITHGKTQL